MTPEEVFAQLRDIHAPAAVAREAIAFDARPVIAFAVFVVVFFALRLLWRRLGARRALASIDVASPPAEQRDALVRVLDARRRNRAAGPAPEAAFQPPKDLTSDGVQRLRRWVLRRIG